MKHSRLMRSVARALILTPFLLGFIGSTTLLRAQPKISVGQLEAWDGSAAQDDRSRFRPIVGLKGMVVSDDPIASEWGAETLRHGGNAVDAAVATAFAMSVTRPHYSSLGGGGFMVYCPPSGECTTIDFREKAPAGASRDMFVRGGKVDESLSKDGALASGVPGIVAGLLHAHAKYGSRPLKNLLSKPIDLARHGFRITGRMESVAGSRWSAFNDEARRIFGCGGKNWARHEGPCAAGTTLRQPELARVLEVIERKGSEGFYKGWVAGKIALGLQKAGGIITVQDLEDYRPIERKPLLGRYQGYEVVTMPPPSAGGAGLLQMLRFAELGNDSLNEGYGAARSIHVLAHAMSLAFADRAKFMGDPDFVLIPLSKLLSDDYLRARWKSLRSDRASLPEGAGNPDSEGHNTTHFSVIDSQGGAVALTETVNENYGSGFVPAGTGIVMNNQMDDFSAQPGVPNLFGLVGAEANAIAPGKRPLSSMAPAIVRDSLGKVRLVLGAQGGPRITTAVFQALVNRIRFGLSIVDAVNVARFHQQWRPSELMVESGAFGADTRAALLKMGYGLKEISASGRMHALERFPNGRVWGAPDRRAEGAAVAE